MKNPLSDCSDEYRFTLTMSGFGADEQAAEDLLEGFLRTHPEAGPVVSLNSAKDSISVTVALDAASRQEARERAAAIWAAGCKSSGLAVGQVTRTEIERVSGSEAVLA